MDGHAGRVDAGGERFFDRTGAGEGREERRVDVHDPVPEAVEERRSQQLHEARQHDQLDIQLLEPGRHDEIALLPARMAVEAEGGRGDAGGTGALQRIRVLPARRDGDDGQAGVDQRLEVRPVAADEHADHSTRPITSSSPGSATTAQ